MKRGVIELSEMLILDGWFDGLKNIIAVDKVYCIPERWSWIVEGESELFEDVSLIASSDIEAWDVTGTIDKRFTNSP